jgi:calcineurin-like phosphoesterase family protein
MIYFSSDLHIGHDKPFIYEARGFKNIQQHDRTIIDNINETVGKEDTLILLGDLCMGPIENVYHYFPQIICKDIKVLWGNHDTDNRLNAYDELRMDTYSFAYASFWKYRHWKFMLSHYPMLTANYGEDGPRCRVWNLHGHTHSKDKYELYPQAGINVGVDANNLRPVEIETILNYIRDRW